MARKKMVAMRKEKKVKDWRLLPRKRRVGQSSSCSLSCWGDTWWRGSTRHTPTMVRIRAAMVTRVKTWVKESGSYSGNSKLTRAEPAMKPPRVRIHRRVMAVPRPSLGMRSTNRALMAVAEMVVPMPKTENSAIPSQSRTRLWGDCPRARAQDGNSGMTARDRNMPPQM